jgi:hypothetical protein
MSDAAAVPMATPVQMHCPLCARKLKKPHKCDRVYGVPVCNKCRVGFANRRQLAYIIDAVIWEFGAVVPMYYLDLVPNPAPMGFSMPDPRTLGIVGVVLTYALSLTFYFKDGFKGMSPGKALCGVQVVDVETHEPIGFWRSLKRNLCLLVPLAPLIIAFMMMGGLRWGDGWARTRVIWRKYTHNPVFGQQGLVCTKCGYDLTANTTGRCPECFTPVPAAPVRSPVN